MENLRIDSPSRCVRDIARMGFNGELHEPAALGQHLGNGRRPYSPCLMRFCRPDSLSPFGRGGLNAYTYCSGDPVNCQDPSGRSALWVGTGLAALALMGVAGGSAAAAERAGARDTSVLLGVVGAALVVAVGAMEPALASILSRPVRSFSPAMPRSRVPSAVLPGRTERPLRGSAIPRVQHAQGAVGLGMTTGSLQSGSVRLQRPITLPLRPRPSSLPAAWRSRAGDMASLKSRLSLRAEVAATKAVKRVRFNEDVVRHQYEQKPYTEAFLMEAQRRVPADRADVECLIASQDPADDYIKVALFMGGRP